MEYLVDQIQVWPGPEWVSGRVGLPILSSQCFKTVAQLWIAKLGTAKQNEEHKMEQFKSKKEWIRKYQEASIIITVKKKLSDEIIKVANLSYKHGEIDFQYIQSLENATAIQVEYLDNVLNLIKPNWFTYLNF
jgi:cobalt-zinc-cadmium resistance protein CzcA